MTRLPVTSQSPQVAPEGAPASASRLFRLQFSLRELLLFVLLVAMALALFTTGWQLHQAKTELAEYRQEYGILKVDDPTTLSAAACWTGEPGKWRWKLHFPPGRYDLPYATTGIPQTGLLDRMGGMGGISNAT